MSRTGWKIHGPLKTHLLPRTVSTLCPHLQSLNGALASTHLIREEGLTAADVAVWVTLHRILGDKTRWEETSSSWENLDHLKKWYFRLEAHPAFKVRCVGSTR